MRGKRRSATQLDRLAGDALLRAGDTPRGALDLVRAAGRITVKIWFVIASRRCKGRRPSGVASSAGRGYRRASRRRPQGGGRLDQAQWLLVAAACRSSIRCDSLSSRRLQRSASRGSCRHGKMPVRLGGWRALNCCSLSTIQNRADAGSTRERRSRCYLPKAPCQSSMRMTQLQPRSCVMATMIACPRESLR